MHNECSADLSAAIGHIDAEVPRPEQRLPEEVFLLVSRLTPLVNVDLLIRDALGRTLLIWRDDPLFGHGWHVPGGVLRLNESFSMRIAAVAANELGARVASQQLKGVYETVDRTRPARTHHVSLLFACTLATPPEIEHINDGQTVYPGCWNWHEHCPENFLQPPYRALIDTPEGVGGMPMTTGFDQQ